MRRILIRVSRAPSLQGMTTPENRKQRSPARVGIETAGVNPSGADRLVSQTTAMQTSASVLASRSPEAVSGLVNEG